MLQMAAQMDSSQGHPEEERLERAGAFAIEMISKLET
jgi:hypothetical protein